jgi:hypothetical protein
MGLAKLKGGLGFMDLVFFNKTLLPKQCWRLLKNPHSLVGNILKAKYYPHASLMQSVLGKRSSFAWRSILGAHQVLEHGMIWIIGNGQDIKIWYERWLPTPISFCSTISPKNSLGNATVAELIDLVTKGWNHSLIAEVFQEEEAKVISSFQISPVLPHAILRW